MPEPTVGFHKFVGFCDDILAVAKDFAIVFFVVLFLFFGPFLRKKFEDVGWKITELGPIKLEEVQKSNQEAKAAASNVDSIQQKIADLEAKMSELSSQNPSAGREINPLKTEVAALKSQASYAQQSLKTTLLSQQDILQKAAPQSVETAGWMYVGQVDESKKGWAGVGAKNISPVPATPEFQPGQTFSVTSDVYLHSSPPGGSWHAQGDVAAVLRQGDRVQVTDVDTSSHAKTGGWFVWLKVKRLP